MPASTLPPFYQMPCTDKNDSLSSTFQLYLDQQSQTLNTIITPYGITVPSFTAAEVAAFPANIAPGTIWYNSTLEELQFIRAGGIIRTITST